ncbi:sugar efflux transporter [Paenibacillus mendelii]|uniref:Sugar efflux transporter n=1 Tax=Paenibacillus mendelii TaxID=206163 RepID=A0ABV6J1T8_9BACL|nr:sugar efflux transporter [Paenibacillus mendelii]MCQ6562764.1 sugar efflux transporter [Paenibacillus mendelii]
MYLRVKSLFAIKGYRLFVLCMLLLGIGISITSPYLSLYFTEVMGMSTGAFGVFMAVSSLSGVVVNSLIAKRSDSGMDRKWIIIAATLSSALSYIAYLLFHNYYILLIAVTLLNGIGAATIPQIYASAHEAATESKSDDKTFAISTMRSLFSLGFLVGPLGGVLLLGALDYNGLFGGTAVIYLIIASAVYLFLQSRVHSNTRKNKTKGISSLRNKQIRYPLIAFIFLFAVNAINSINTPLFIVNELKGTHTEVGLVVSICAGLEIPIMIALGALNRKISNQVLMISGCVIAIIYFIILSVSSDSWHLIAAQLLQATFVAIVMGNGLSYFTSLLPDSPGLATTFYANSSTIGRLVGSLGGGFIAQYIGFRYVNWVCLAIAVISFFIFWKTRPKAALAVSE